MHSLSTQVGEFHDWKAGLVREIQTYRNALRYSSTASEDLLARLDRAIAQLGEDELTIAFVGEYSRGKTELINALIFSQYGRRMLPSQAGRTTMCPTELFYDRKRQASYLRLLPIESRRLNLSIAELKTKGDLWKEFPINLDDEASMNNVLQQVAETVSMTMDDAKALGFEPTMVENDPDERDHVLIPKWRHAELSLKSPLLEKGLRILDTPGLNALGSEPELTISMIPNAQAVIFLLSADAGVTASDMAIWNDYIASDDANHEAGRFAVLNKIDVLWDDIQGETHTAASVERVKKDTAMRLGMNVESVIPVSAKQALMAQLKDDKALYAKSALPKLEQLIHDEILVARERILHDSVIEDISALVESSERVVSQRIEKLTTQLDRLKDETHEKETLSKLADQTQKDHEDYFQKLVALRSSRRLMNSQGQILADLVNDEKFDALVEQTKNKMQHAWSTLGMSAAMQGFFKEIDKLLDGLCIEAKVADKMVDMIYKRFKSEESAAHLHPKPFTIKKQRIKLAELKNNLSRYRRNPRMLMTEQTLLVKRFINSFVREARVEFMAAHEAAERWSEEALLPIMQYTLEKKNGLQEQMEELRKLAQESRTQREEIAAMESMIEKLDEQLKQTHRIYERLRMVPNQASTA